jgi:hypothetical protein
LREHPDAVEADLSRHYGIDIRDRWRVVDGRRVLTLRMIAVRLRHMPADSAVGQIARGNEPEWRLEHVLLAHVWQAAAHSKTQHPGLVRATKQASHHQQTSPQRLAAISAGRQRAEARRRRLAAAALDQAVKEGT